MSAYCSESDLLVDKSTPLPLATNRGSYITMSSDYMDARLALAYQTPLPLDPTLPGSETDIALLRTICTRLATGALILAITAGSERHSVHAYGKELIERGEEMLQQLIDGSLNLVSISRIPSATDTRPAGPLVGHGTSFNMTDGYYHNFEPYGITPGRVRPDEEGDWPFDVGVI